MALIKDGKQYPAYPKDSAPTEAKGATFYMWSPMNQYTDNPNTTSDDGQVDTTVINGVTVKRSADRPILLFGNLGGNRQKGGTDLLADVSESYFAQHIMTELPDGYVLPPIQE